MGLGTGQNWGEMKRFEAEISLPFGRRSRAKMARSGEGYGGQKVEEEG